VLIWGVSFGFCANLDLGNLCCVCWHSLADLGQLWAVWSVLGSLGQCAEVCGRSDEVVSERHERGAIIADDLARGGLARLACGEQQPPAELAVVAVGKQATSCRVCDSQIAKLLKQL